MRMGVHFPPFRMHSCAQGTKGFQEAAYTSTSESCELKLQILKWRKRTAILRLRLSNLEETVGHIQDNAKANVRASREALDDNAALRQNLQLALEYFDAERATTLRLQVGGHAACQYKWEGCQPLASLLFESAKHVGSSGLHLQFSRTGKSCRHSHAG